MGLIDKLTYHPDQETRTGQDRTGDKEDQGGPRAGFREGSTKESTYHTPNSGQRL